MSARRRKVSPLARIRPFWLPISLVAAIVVAALGVTATWPGFETERIVIRGNHRVSQSEILSRAHVAFPRSIWLQNAGAIARRIEAIPYVGRVWIHRVPPSSIQITITERQPFAVLRSPPESVVVDHALRVLEPATGSDPQTLFIVRSGLVLVPGAFVTAREAITLRDAYDAMAARRIAPVALRLDRFGGLVVRLHSGLELLLGEGELSQKLSLVDAILAQVVREPRRVAAIDVRAPGTPVVVYR